jgi:hypothetical protein
MGGAGRHGVTASFGGTTLRELQLLSHRMFHAFLDTTAGNPGFYYPGNLWLTEGLAVYYENISLKALGENTKDRLGVNPDRQLATLFAQFLYMRLKYPDFYEIAPMSEREIMISDHSGARAEFLHYTAAPLIVAYLERTSAQAGNPPDMLLRFFLDNADITAGDYIGHRAAAALLGTGGREFRELYFNSPGIPPLWDLSEYLPPEEELIIALNDIEYVMASFRRSVNPGFTPTYIDGGKLSAKMDHAVVGAASIADPLTDRLVRGFSLPLYAALLLGEMVWAG